MVSKINSRSIPFSFPGRGLILRAPGRCAPIFLSMFLTLPALYCRVALAAISPGSAPRAAQTAETFNIAAEPMPSDWKYFLNAPASFRQGLWQYNIERGKELKHWAWQWRLGWVRACTESADQYCQQIFKAALSDRAVVVRADAAARLGRRFAGTSNSWAAGLLLAAARDPRNLRHGQPLYIQQRILFALKQIGGSKNLLAAETIARANKKSAAYWDKLNRL